MEETLRKHIYIARGHGFLQQINAADGSEVSAPDAVHSSQRRGLCRQRRERRRSHAYGQGCGGLLNAFYPFNLATRKGKHVQSGGGGMWGHRRVAVSPEGTAYMVPALRHEASELTCQDRWAGMIKHEQVLNP